MLVQDINRRLLKIFERARTVSRSDKGVQNSSCDLSMSTALDRAASIPSSFLPLSFDQLKYFGLGNMPISMEAMYCCPFECRLPLTRHQRCKEIHHESQIYVYSDRSFGTFFTSVDAPAPYLYDRHGLDQESAAVKTMERPFLSWWSVFFVDC